MTVKRKSLEEIRHLGYEALTRELGPADFVRFLQQFETGRGNYTEERHRWLDQVDEATLVERIQQRRETAPSPTQGKAAEEGAQADGE
jgi:hypothetical protein